MKYIFKHMTIAAVFCITAHQLVAQGKKMDVTTDSSTTKVDNVKEPGRLFQVNKKYSTASVSTVSGTTLYKTPDANLANTMVGRLTGLYVKQSSGEPTGTSGSVSATMMSIRGRGTYGINGNNGYNTYKIFVDGFETNINYFVEMPTAAIKSISILKDAAALSTFGMRGDEGIIWVITKRGTIGKSKVHFSLRSGRQQPIQIYKPLESYDYARLYNEAASNDNGNIWSPVYNQQQLAAYKNGKGTNIDWYDRVLKSSAPYTDGDITFSGGNQAARYNVLMGYLNQQGLYRVANTDETSNEMLKRYNIRANLDFNLFKIFKARIDIGGNITNHKGPNYSTSALWNNMARYPANIYPVQADSGKWSGTALYPDNPIASIKALGWASQHYRNLIANFGLRETLDFITPGLYLDEAYSFNSYGSSTYGKTASYARYYNGATTTTDKKTPIKAQPQYPAGQEYLKQVQATLGYKHAFENSKIQSALNYYQSDYRGDGLIFYATHYQNISGKVNYNYKNRYIGVFGFSYYGSDAFAPNHRWGFYPALSGAWIVSNEGFLENNSIISFLKVRASAGKSGGIDDNAYQSGRYLYQQYYRFGAISGGSFYMGNANPTGATILDPLYTANPNAFAERSMKYDVGADLTLIGRLTLSLDIFMDKRSNILTTDNATPDYFGYNISYKNIGKVTNKGFEVSGKYADKIGQVGYSVTAMAAYNTNKIDYMAEVPPAYPYNAATGRSIGIPIGLVAEGYYQLDDFNADGSLKKGEPVPSFGNIQPGDLKYKDLNGDGKIDQTDVTAIGNPSYPKLTYSFGGELNFKGFDLNVFFVGAEGADVNILNSAQTQTEAFVNNGNVFSIAENAWAYYPNQGIDTRAKATYPRLTTVANNNNYRSSSFWMKSADFLRLHNVELGYDFSHSLLKKSGISQFRIYITAVNPVTWSTLLKDYHMDPETLAGYPALKSYDLGISVTF